jgi:hypothetical protein
MSQTPATLICEKCGAEARVLTEGPSEHRAANPRLASDDERAHGFYIMLECPHCDRVRQQISPPPATIE